MERYVEPGKDPAESIKPAEAGDSPEPPPVDRREGHRPTTLIPASPADRDNRDIYLMLQHIGGRKEGFANPANGLTFAAWQEFACRIATDPPDPGDQMTRDGSVDQASLQGSRPMTQSDSLVDTPSGGREVAREPQVADRWYWYWQGGVCLGYGILRLHPDPDTLRNHGHLAYAIRRDRRGKGHGKSLFALLLQEARRLRLTDPVLVCSATNLASRRVIEGAGGRLARVEEGKCRYRWDMPDQAG